MDLSYSMKTLRCVFNNFYNVKMSPVDSNLLKKNGHFMSLKTLVEDLATLPHVIST